MVYLTEATGHEYRKLPRGGIVADHQPAMFRPTKRVLLWLADVPQKANLENPNTEKEASPDDIAVPERPSKSGETIWEIAAKRRRGYEQAKSKVTKKQSKKDRRMIIDLTKEDASELSGGRLHVMQRTRLDTSGTHYRTTVKVIIDLTENDTE